MMVAPNRPSAEDPSTRPLVDHSSTPADSILSRSSRPAVSRSHRSTAYTHTLSTRPVSAAATAAIRPGRSACARRVDTSTSDHTATTVDSPAAARARSMASRCSSGLRNCWSARPITADTRT